MIQIQRCSLLDHWVHCDFYMKSGGLKELGIKPISSALMGMDTLGNIHNYIFIYLALHGPEIMDLWACVL